MAAPVSGRRVLSVMLAVGLCLVIGVALVAVLTRGDRGPGSSSPSTPAAERAQ